MKLLTAAKIRAWDQYTMEHEPVSSLGLMERAAIRCFDAMIQWLKQNKIAYHEFAVLCGQGNNGGDGLVIARKLKDAGQRVKVIVLALKENGTDDFQINLQRYEGTVTWIKSADDIEQLPDGVVWIDALFGSGLNAPLHGLAASLVNMVNQKNGVRLSVDLPGGLSGDIELAMGWEEMVCIEANATFTFQVPKTSLLFPETGRFSGDLQVLDIGLHPGFLKDIAASWHYIRAEDLPKRTGNRFQHKGNRGHSLIIGGSYGKMGAMVLSAKAALLSGSGLVTVYLPSVGYTILQTALPEAMVVTDERENELGTFPDTSCYDAIGVGPGMGTHADTVSAFMHWIANMKQPVVIDADGLNALSLIMQKNPGFRLPAGAILTPHPKEFERLFGPVNHSLDRIKKAVQIAGEHQVVLVLKGANTAVIAPDGQVYFNSTGNALLATAGSGDVLTGIITSLLAQGFDPLTAARKAVLMHGLAADHLKAKGLRMAMSGDIADALRETEG